jgi:hypothetical protein
MLLVKGELMARWRDQELDLSTNWCSQRSGARCRQPRFEAFGGSYPSDTL